MALHASQSTPLDQFPSPSSSHAVSSVPKLNAFALNFSHSSESIEARNKIAEATARIHSELLASQKEGFAKIPGFWSVQNQIRAKLSAEP